MIRDFPPCSLRFLSFIHLRLDILAVHLEFDVVRQLYAQKKNPVAQLSVDSGVIVPAVDIPALPYKFILQANRL